MAWLPKALPLQVPRSLPGLGFYICFVQAPQQVSLIVLHFSSGKVMHSHGIYMDEGFHYFQVMSRSRITTVHKKFHHVTWLDTPWG